MAKQGRAPVSPKGAKQAPAKKQSAPMTMVGIAAALVGLVVVALPTVTLMFIGLLPTVVAYVIDRSPQKYATFCVGGMNFCGVFPYVLDLWRGAHTMAGAFKFLTNAFALLLMYGSAAFGWALFAAIPPVVVAVLTVISQRRVSTLRTNQRRIIEEWGEDVAKVMGKG
ncbi:MAG: acyl-CoA synthetase [Magnetospirillum sp. WYHS-4]